MELPSTQMHRTYRVRVHGRIDQSKINRIERGMVIPSSSSSSANNEGWSGGDMRYRGMKVHVETPRKRKMNSTNQWIQITCTEGKNRQIRNVLKYLGCTCNATMRRVWRFTCYHILHSRFSPLLAFGVANQCKSRA